MEELWNVCIYNKMEIRPFNIHYIRKKREYFRSINFKENKKKLIWIIVGELWNVVFITKWKEDSFEYFLSVYFICKKKRENVLGV